MLLKQPHGAEVISIVFEVVHSLRKHLAEGRVVAQDGLDDINVECRRARNFAEAAVGGPDTAHSKSGERFKRSDIEKVEEGSDISKK